MKNDFAARLLKNRFRSPHELRRLWEVPKPAPHQHRRKNGRRHDLKGVVKGQFVRVKLPQKEPVSSIPKLHSPASPPVQSFSQPPTDAPSLQKLTQASQAKRKEFLHEYWDRLKAWTKHNFAVIVLNFGSVCSLVGFTRSDVRKRHQGMIQNFFMYNN